jgi:hypothetical protein
MPNGLVMGVAACATLIAGASNAQQTLCQKYDAWMDGAASRLDGGKPVAVSDQMSLDFDQGYWNGRDASGKGPYFGQADITTCTATTVEFKVREGLGDPKTCKLDDKGAGTCTLGSDTQTLLGKLRPR